MIRSALFLSVACLASNCQSEDKKEPIAISAPAQEAQAYKLEAGPYQVASVEDLVLRDEKRGKDLHVAIRYPEGEGLCPVVVFSHGLGGSGKNYFPLTQHWARHGYIVLQPTHADSIAEGKRFSRQEAEKGLADPQAASNRAADDSFLIDSIETIMKNAPQLAGRMDAQKIGLAGHSFGAHTTQMLAGALHLGKNYADPRVKAFLLLSGQGSGRAGFDEKSWEKIERPMMVMSGSLDTGAMGEGPQWRMEPYRRCPAGDKYSVFLEGATHMSFTGALAESKEKKSLRSKIMERRAKGTDQQLVFDAVKVSTLAFWDAYVKEDKAAKEYLGSNSMADWGKPIVSFERK